MTTATATVPALVSAQGKLVWDVYGAIVLADWLTSTREAPSTTSNKETTKTWRRRGDGRSNTWASARLTSPSAPTPSYQCSRWLLAHLKKFFSLPGAFFSFPDAPNRSLKTSSHPLFSFPHPYCCSQFVCPPVLDLYVCRSPSLSLCLSLYMAPY